MRSLSNFLTHRIRLLISLVIAFWLVSLYYLQLSQLHHPSVPEDEFLAAPLTGPLASVLTPRALLAQPLANSLTEVPRLIHQSWKNDSLSPRFSAWSQTWRQQHPDWQWVFWTDADNYALVVKYFPWFLDTYNRLLTDICRADVARNMYMFVYGGMYADLDFECLRPFDTVFQSYNTTLGPLSLSLDPDFAHSNLKFVDHTQHAFFGRMGSVHDKGAFLHSVPNAWMASSPGHPFFTFVLRTLQRKMDDSVNLELSSAEEPPIRFPIMHFILRFLHLTRVRTPISADSTPEELTGPVALHEALTAYSHTKAITDEVEIEHPSANYLELRKQMFGDVAHDMTSKVHILPKELIYPYSWAKETRRFKRVCEASSKKFNATRCKIKVDVVGKGSYSITYWSHSWAAPW